MNPTRIAEQLSTPPIIDVHTLILPGPGLGHINGGLLLAKALVSVGFSLVTVVCFARSYAANANKIQPLLGGAQSSNIRLEIVPDGLSTDIRHYGELFVTSPAMQYGLKKLIRRLNADKQHQPVTCLVSDTFMAWSQDVADTFGIPRIDYWTGSANSYLLVLGAEALVSNGHIPFEKPPTRWKSENPTFIDWMPGLPGFPMDEMPKNFSHVADVDSDAFVQRCLEAASRARDAERVLIHTVYELESRAFEQGLALDYGIKAYATGPLIQNDLNATSENGNYTNLQEVDCMTNEEVDCMRWLDTQANSSVIYVSFGSNATLATEEIVELAHGLEASGQPFLWVIRTDAVLPCAEKLAEDIEPSFSFLPKGFEVRTKARGLIMAWAPQVAVLRHPAVGGFLTHCGWNSVIESLWNGVPMLGCPRAAEQRTNARFIAHEWGFGVEMEHTEEGGLARVDVEDGVKTLIVGEEGKRARKKVRQLGHALRNNNANAPSPTLLAFARDMQLRQY